MGPPIGVLGEIDGLHVPPGKASDLLTDQLITGVRRCRCCPQFSNISETVEPIKAKLHVEHSPESVD